MDLSNLLIDTIKKNLEFIENKIKDFLFKKENIYLNKLVCYIKNDTHCYYYDNELITSIKIL
jgi:hypothetical protein